jgi:hypothetical protein
LYEPGAFVFVNSLASYVEVYNLNNED